MKNSAKTRIFLAATLVALLGFSGYMIWSGSLAETPFKATGYESSEELLKQVKEDIEGEGKGEKEEHGKSNKPRYEYFFKLLRDPETNAIPDNVRSRELNYARSLPSFRQVKSKMKDKKLAQVAEFHWNSAGPTDVGGRTRALEIDRRNSEVIISGGVSGGIWKSTDGGDNWDLKTPETENLSVTSLAQHPVNPATWYYTSGEFIGNTASADGASYYGTGIFRSTDNGETWNRIPSTNTDNATSFDSPFDFMSRIKIHPNGTVYVASNGFGILRSPDGNDYSDVTLGGPGYHAYADIDIASDGKIIAALSSRTASAQPVSNNPGIFLSEDDGQSWQDVTPNTFPGEYGRSVLAFAPSDPDIVYVLTDKINSQTNQGVSFHKLNLATGESWDYSENLPDFRSDGDGSGYMNLQDGYNMLVAVKPDNPDYVFVGGTNLFRSTDGFSQSPQGGYDAADAALVDQYWIGGYSQQNNFASYPNHHPDQHVIAFDPNNPNRMWTGHDGGLSLTEDVTAQEVSWTDKNSGYITTQFYTSAIPAAEGDNRVMGGTQDNGTPFFRYPAGENLATTEDISFGDGSYCFFTPDLFYVSSQNGIVIRYNKNSSGNIAGPFAYVFPSAADNQLFIHPYAVDPNDQGNLYYPDGNELWRTTRANEISNQNSDGTSTGFSNLQQAALDSNYTISALEVSLSPGNILYYAGSGGNQDRPVIKKLTNANSSNSAPEDISIESAPPGGWVKDIAINPVNANEMLVVMSNYNIEGLYHTLDGGQNWAPVEGNLTGDPTNPGPSLRSAAIIPSDEGTIYLAGTSTGLYTATLFDGNNTEWGQDAAESIGYAVTDHLASRISDGDIAAGTHGRGMFIGDFQGNTDAPFIVAEPLEARAGANITLTANDFEFSSNPADNEVRFGEVPAKVLSATAGELQVEVPRGVVARQAENNSVLITVTTGGQSLSTTFEILPPNNFTISQNYPNPFNGTTTIPFDIPVDSRVSLTIYSITGQEVLQPLSEAEYNAGTYNQNIDLSQLASGVYIFRIISESRSEGGQRHMESKKMTLIK